MIVIRVRNVNHALPAGMSLLENIGVREESRNGPVLRAPEPVCTVYERPQERVLFSPRRDANPFFHFYESLWMLAGRNDVAPVAKYVKRMRDYSDDGETFAAAYGRRWRAHGATVLRSSNVGIDQLIRICRHLRDNPSCRRQVLQIWDVERDLTAQSGKRDIACNVNVIFHAEPDPGSRRKRQLDMTVTCRSNDMIWGAYGANAVHFSMLHEYVATFAGLGVGVMNQISVNFHAYESVLEKLRLDQGPLASDSYSGGLVRPRPIVDVPSQSDWDDEVRLFVTDDGSTGDFWRGRPFKNTFFYDVARPIVSAHDIYAKSRDETRFTAALAMLDQCHADDWREACKAWILRRRARYLRAADDGPVNY